MKPQNTLNLRRAGLLVGSLSVLPSLASLRGQSAPNSPTPTDQQQSIVTLSPFSVTSDAQKGYMATQTLNGTRLKTSVGDIGAAMTIFTDQLMDDLAANSVLDLASFAPNTDPYVGNISDTTGNGNEFLTAQSPQYVTRGGSTGLVSQDFFSTPTVPPDRYNAQDFTFTRGPNAILFGLGNAAGAFVSSSKRALFQNQSSLEMRGDSNGGVRTTIDLNAVIRPKLLAVRFAGLDDNIEGFRNPSRSTQHRAYLTTLFTPFEKTAIRVNFETGKLHTVAVRPWPAFDGITPWIDAGKPLLATAKTGNTKVAGIQNAYAGPAQSLIFTEDTPAGTVVPPMSWALQGRSATPAYPAYPVLGPGLRSLVNSSLFPLTANVTGDGTFRDLSFNSAAVFIEQQITPDLYLEGAINHIQSDTLIASGVGGGSGETIFADVNQQLPNGAPNPNVGKYYVDSFTNYLPSRYKDTTARVMTSYELDFAKLWPRYGAWLGRHRIAGLFEDGSTGQWSSQNPSQNVTPLPGAPALITNLTNRVIFRHYLDPANGVTNAGAGGATKYPLIFAGDPLPAPNPSGVTPALAAIFGGAASDTELMTQMVATQSYFWKDRIVATLGLRQDDQTIYNGQQADFLPWADSRGLYPDPRLFDAKRYFARSRTQQRGHTYTHGVVFHAFSWLSLSYNKSNNLLPNSTIRDVDGNLLPHQEGSGEDYGLKFQLAGGRVFADLVYYRNFSLNRPDTSVANGVQGNFQNDINAIWTTIAGIQNDPKYLNQPYAFTGSVWQDINTGYSDGYEATVTANVTPHWRLMVDGSRRGPGSTESRGSLLKAYLAQYIPVWQNNPAWNNAPLSGGIVSGTVADAIARLQNTLANFNALASLPSDSLLSARWSANAITTYEFAGDTRLKGFSVGASANLRGPTVIGFADDSHQVLIASQPYYAPDFTTIGSWITYRRKLFAGKIGWRLQLNVQNLLDANKLFPMHAVDRLDGSGAPAVVLYRLNEPRTYLLTSTFTF